MARTRNAHSPYFELAKSKWDAGLWNERMLRALVAAGRITAAEFTEITGIEY